MRDCLRCADAALRRLPLARDCECATALKYALVTPAELVPERLKRDLAPIVGRYMPADASR